MRIMHMTFEDGGEVLEVEAGRRITMRMEECT